MSVKRKSGKPTKSKKSFRGILTEPVEIKTKQTTLLTDTPKNRASISKHNHDEYLKAIAMRLEKLNPLCRHYNIDTDADFTVKMMLLVFKLAEEFVPGFRVKDLRVEKKKGRPKKWDAIKYCRLIADIELLKKENVGSDSEACRILTTSSRFRERWGKFNKENLENRLVMARDEDKNVIQKLFNSMEEKNHMNKTRFTEILIESFGTTDIQQ